MSEAKIQTAEDLLPLLNQLPEFEKILLLQRVTFSVPPQFDGEKFTEIYKGRLIEVSPCQEGWHALYIEPSGEKILEGALYDTAEKSLKAARFAITWEIEQDEIMSQFKELIDQFKAKGYTQAGILNGLTDALRNTLDKSDWREEIIQFLEKAVRAGRLPGRVLP